MARRVSNITAFLLLAVVLGACTTGVEPSPDPGVLRVVLQADPADTSIVVGRQQLHVEEGDALPLLISQGKAYADTTFFILYEDTRQFQQTSQVVNVLDQEDGRYASYTLFESFLPPGQYDRLEFSLEANDRRRSGGVVDVGSFSVPVRQAPEAPTLRSVPVSFQMSEAETTTVYLRIAPLQSLQRFQNVFHFDPVIDVEDVERHP